MGNIPLSTLYVENYKGSKISLDHDIPTLLAFLKIQIRESEYVDLSDSDIILFKLQLWLEELITTLDKDCNEYNISHTRFINKTISKYLHINIKHINKIHPLFIYDQKYSNKVIMLVLTMLLSMKNRNDLILSTNFFIQIGRHYIYRFIFYPDHKDSEESFDTFLVNNNITPQHVYKLGSHQAEPMIQLGYFESIYHSDDTHRSHIIVINDVMNEFIKGTYIADNISLPMISKPIKWSKKSNTYIGGNYRTDIFQLNFIHVSGMHRHKISNIDNILTNVNNMQSIPLIVNKSLMDYITNNNLNLDAYDHNIQAIAKLYSNIKLFLPLYIDWRGRIYTSHSTLTYQGKSLAKNLLLMYNKERLTDDGVKGLMIYLAMCYGLTHESNNNKLLWCNRNKDRIINLDKELISSSDDIYDFISASLAYKEYCLTGFASVNIKLDATCSGIQHISGLLEDIDLGYHVNIKSSNDDDNPEDIYTYIIPSIKDSIYKLVHSSQDNFVKYSNLLKLPITRSLVKKPVMTIPYTVSVYGIHEHIISMSEVIKTYDQENPKKYVITYRFKDCNNSPFDLTKGEIMQLSNIIHQCIRTQFPVLDKLFTYYNLMVNILIKCDLNIEWVTPTGVTVKQSYISVEDERVVFKINRKRRDIVLKRPILPFKVDNRKSKNSIIPNIIHSLDSAHLNKIVTELNNLNVDVLTIHDCFIINPNNWLILHKTVIDMYIKLYSDESFINKFHQTCLDTIKSKYVIHDEQGDKVITELGLVIPNTPYKRSNDFFDKVKSSRYMVK